MERFVNAYRPEQHYMRGPGPKWHAKHTASLVVAAGLQPMVSQRAPHAGQATLQSSVLGWVASTVAAATLGFMAVIILA